MIARAAITLFVTTMWLATAHVCRAEYVELPGAKTYSEITLLALGVPALALDVVSIAYIRKGPGRETGRKVVFGLQVAEASLLSLAGLVSYRYAGSGADSPDAEITTLTACHFVVALASLGLGVWMMVGVPPGGGADVPTAVVPRASWMIAPLVVSGVGTEDIGISVAGLY
jgi:hypothetical protein